MEHFCKVIMAGRATADPVRRTSPNRWPIAAVGFVFNDKYQAGDEWRDRPMFIDLEAEGDLALEVLEFVRRGTALLIEGKLRLDEWTDAAQVRHRRHKIILHEIRIMEKRTPKISGAAAPKTAAPVAIETQEPEPI